MSLTPKLEDTRIGSILVQECLNPEESYSRKRRWNCICDCGKIVSYNEAYLLNKEKEGGLHCHHLKNVRIGDKFGRLTVIEEAPPRKSKANKSARMWLCKCECGTIKEIGHSDLYRGHTKSCGCLNRDNTIKRNKDGKKYNSYIVVGDVTVGFTRKGESFLFDTKFLPHIRSYCWHTNKGGYIESSKNKPEDKRHVFLHRLVTNCPDGYFVDHINHDVADNRISNLRIVTASENTINTKTRNDNKTGHRGVSYREEWDRYQVNIQRNGKSEYLGLFKSFEDACKAYDDASNRLFGEYKYNPNTDSRISTLH